VALEAGARTGELLALTRDRVDLSRGVIRLELTKSGKRREVPMRQTVYDVVATLPGRREGRETFLAGAEPERCDEHRGLSDRIHEWSRRLREGFLH